MRKLFKIIKNTIIGIIFVIYLGIIITASTLVLNRNDYGYTQFGKKVYLDLKEDTGIYKKGQLVITDSIKFENLVVGDEIFIYKTDADENTIEIINSTIKKIVTEDTTTPYVTIDLDDSAWGSEFIVGKTVKVYDSIGSIISFIESKWIFFIIFVVPCFFILLYEIYSVIMVVKFDVDDDCRIAVSNPNAQLNGSSMINVANEQNASTSMDDIEAIKAQINNLKVQLSEEQAINNQSEANTNLGVDKMVTNIIVPTQEAVVANAEAVSPPTTVVANVEKVSTPTTVVANVEAVSPPTTVVANAEAVSPPTTVVANVEKVSPPTTVVANVEKVSTPTTVVANVEAVSPPTTVVTNSAAVSTPATLETPVMVSEPKIVEENNDVPQIVNVQVVQEEEPVVIRPDL